MGDILARGIASTKVAKTYVDGVVAAVNASPKGVYADLATLSAALPAGNANVYLTADDGKWCYWNGSAWTAGSIYQSMGITDGSVTSVKTTPNAHMGLLSYSTKPMNFDFTANTITFFIDTVLFFKKGRYLITNSSVVTIDISTATTSIYYSLLYDVITNTFSFVASNNVNTITENQVLIATFYRNSKKVSSPSAFTIDDGAECDGVGVLVSDNSYPNFAFASNKIIFYANTTLLYKNKRYVITSTTDVEVDISGLAAGQLYALYYDRVAGTFIIKTTGDIGGTPALTTYTLIATFNTGDKTVWIVGGFKVDGVLFGYSIPTPTTVSRFLNLEGNFLGDSFTWGYNPADGTQLANPFPTLVGNTLGLLTVNNYGLTGSVLADYAGDGVTRSPMCVRYVAMSDTAELIFVLAGTNDWAQNVAIGTITDAVMTTFYGGLNALVDGLLTKYPTQTIVLATPMHREGDTVANTASATLLDYVNAIKAIGIKFGVAVLDLYATSGFYPDNAVNYTAICPDGRHPNAAGHVKLAHRISGFLMTV